MALKTPTTPKDFTKNFMLTDIDPDKNPKRTAEDVDLFTRWTDEWTREVKDPRTGETLTRPDWAKIRSLYIPRFYPEIDTKKKAKKSEKKPLTTAEKLALLKEKAKQAKQ